MVRDRSSTLETLYGDGPRIFPSLLSCDFGILAEEIAAAEQAGAVAVHWDVMDGDFVPNFTYGPPILRSLRSRTDLIFDAHLMMSQPQKYLDDFISAGCDMVTIHLEAVAQPGDLLREIRDRGVLAGLAINPPTPVERIEPWLNDVDLVLVMSVEPGFGGQKFDPRALDKLQWLRSAVEPVTLLQVDGGVNSDTISGVVGAGARLLVVGSAFYGAKDRPAQFDVLMRRARECDSLRG